MGIKIFISAICLALSVMNCSAQTETLPAKKFNHSIGVQANQLIRQIINLNNSNTTAIDNPYLLVYSLNMINGGWGVSAGAGYDYRFIKDKLPVSKESKINNFFYRIGVNRRVMIGKRFEAGYGLDFVGDYQVTKTFSSAVTVFGSSIDSSFSTSTTKIESIGGGPQLYLGFYFSNRLVIGTEASYYLVRSSQKENDLVTDNITDQFNGNSVSTSNTNVEKEVAEFSFNLPVALFLILKF